MTGTELVVVKSGAPIVAIDHNNINFDLAEKWLSTQGGQRAFAGEQLSFNGQDGVYKLGFGKNAQEFEELELVVNVPYLADAWQDWSGEAPKYPFIALPFAGQALPRRETLGNHDQALWQDDKFNKGKKRDPWSEIIVVPMRTEKGRLFHFMAANITSRNGILAIIRDAVVDGKRYPGKLPVVSFTREKIKSDDGNFWVIKHEIVRWIAAEAQDNPGAQMTVSTDASPVDSADAGEGKTVAKPRSAAKPASAKVEEAPKTSKMAEAVDTSDDEPEQESKPAPVRRRSLI